MRCMKLSGSKEEAYFFHREQEILAALAHPRSFKTEVLVVDDFAFIGAIGDAADRLSEVLHDIMARTLVVEGMED